MDATDETTRVQIAEPFECEIFGERFTFPLGLFTVASLAEELSKQSKRLRFFESGHGGLCFTERFGPDALAPSGAAR